jgi:Domain of unknown function (DUF4208)
MVIGEHIEGFVASKGPGAEKWEQRLWAYVSRTTENSMDGPKLRAVFSRLKGDPKPRLREEVTLGLGTQQQVCKAEYRVTAAFTCGRICWVQSACRLARPCR